MTFDIGVHEECVRVGVRYVITKFSRMDSLPNFVTHGAPLLAYCVVCQISVKLQRVLNASARLIYCAPKSNHITPLLRELLWLPVCYRIECKILLLTFKVLHGMAPDYLRQLISVLPLSKYDLRRNHDSGVLLASPKVRTKIILGDRSFSCVAPRLWHLLPSTTRSISSLNTFKNILKTFVFN